MAAAMLSFAVLDGFRKALSESVPAGLIVASRYIVFCAVVLYWRRGRTRPLLATEHPVLQTLRALVMAAEATIFVYALRDASLADANAVFALAPVAGVLLAIALLGERARPSTWLTIALSLGGILLMVHPDAHSREQGLLLALASAVLYALYGVLTRKVSDRDDPRTSFAYMTLVGAAAVASLSAVQAPHWHVPSSRDGAYLALAALAAAAGQYLLIRAYALAPAAMLQPYTYLLFAWSVPISMIFFDAPPSGSSLAGALLVVASGIWLFTRGNRPE